MVTAEITIKNKTGLHARPAATFSAAAAKFRSDIKVKNLDRDTAEVNAKSTVRILTLAISQGIRIRLTASGEDEETALATLVALIEDGFGEL